MSSGRRHLKRYQLQWRPTFAYHRRGARIYVLGEKRKLVGAAQDSKPEETTETPPEQSYDHNLFSLQEIVRVANNSVLILPFNATVAMAQEYSPKINNKLVYYHTLGGNSVTTFGQGIRRIGLRIVIIKVGRLWEVYEKGLQAMAYLSANQGRFFGGLYLIGYDAFSDGTEEMFGRYKVTVESLEFLHRADQNTRLMADMSFIVLHDYGHYQSEKNRIWGAL